ncbi:unnamed protein product [Peronospora farinosa]|nr:unnamed protein product [Peronospora farinosa]
MSMRQGKMAMRDYVQMARHLASCIITHPMDMYTQVNVFVDGMREGQNRLSLERADPATMEEAFAIALQPMEIDVIESSGYRRRVISHKGDALAGRQMVCFRCRKPGHRAAECRALAPISVQVVDVHHEGAVPATRPRKRSGPVGAGRPTRWNGGPGPSVAAQPSSTPALRARLNATTTSGDLRLINVSLHVAGVRRPLRALLNSGATNNFFRISSLSMLPPSIQVREGPGQVVFKLADGKPHLVSRRKVLLPYTFDGFRSNDDFLVIAMNYAFDCILGMPWLARYKPQIDWLARSVRRRRKFDVSEVFTHLLVSPSDWPNVTVVDRDSTTLASEEDDEDDAVEQGFPRVINAVEQGFPHGLPQGHCDEEQELANECDVDGQESSRESMMVEPGFPSSPTVVEPRFPHGHIVVEQGLPHEYNVDGQESPRESMMVEPGFPSSPTVVEPRFPHGHIVVEQGLPHGFTAAEQELPHQVSTVEFGVLPSSVSGIVDEDIQCVEGGDGLSPDCGSPASSSDSKHDGDNSTENLALECVHAIVYV